MRPLLRKQESHRRFIGVFIVVQRIGLSFLLCTVVLSGCSTPPPIAAPSGPSNLTTDVEFRSFLARGYPEQDVYIETIRGTPEVHRFQVSQSQNPAMMTLTFESPVFGVVSPEPHDPFKLHGGGKTYEKGRRLGVALQVWGNAFGVGTYSVQNGTATLKVRVQSMMRNAMYSLWCARVSKTVFQEKPCDEKLPLIETDAKGRATAEFTFPAPLDSTTETGSWLLLAYHSDRHRKPIGNDFGKTTHVQAFFPIPTPAETQPIY